jgi:hypothetical protein
MNRHPQLALAAFLAGLGTAIPAMAQTPVVPSGTGPGGSSAPGPTIVDTTVTVRWNAVTGVVDYDLGVRDMTTNQLVVDRRVRTNSHQIALTPGRTYRWNVAACNVAGCSRFTSPLYFSVAGTRVTAPPTVPAGLNPGRQSPCGGSVQGASVTLSWRATAGADEYDLGVRDMTTNQLVVDRRVRTNSHEITLSPGRTYRWNVAACNVAGCSGFAPPVYFTAAEPVGGANCPATVGRLPLSGTITQRFGADWSENRNKKHTGVDIAAAMCACVPSVQPGKVVKIGDLGRSRVTGEAWGKYVLIDSGERVHGYLHVRPSVKAGQEVRAGQKIGGIWKNHLHYNVCKKQEHCQLGALPRCGEKDAANPSHPPFPGAFLDPEGRIVAHCPD